VVSVSTVVLVDVKPKPRSNDNASPLGRASALELQAATAAMHSMAFFEMSIFKVCSLRAQSRTMYVALRRMCLLRALAGNFAAWLSKCAPCRTADQP
jgi:hypothetical protein